MAMVKIVNLSEDEDYLDAFDGTQYLVPAGGAQLVPEEAMMLWLGDPAKRDVGKNRDRLEEFQRLQTRYGVHDGGVNWNGPDIPAHTWDDAKPQLAAFTMADEPIVTVADDPTGLSSSGAGNPVFSNEELSRMLIKQQEDNRRLIELLGSERAGAVDPLEPAADAMPPVDKPNRTQVSGKPRQPRTPRAGK